MRALTAAVVALGLCGCVTNTPSPSSDGDPAVFAAQVQPVLARHCSFLCCHGREGMPLGIYAVDYLRLSDPKGLVDPTSPPLDERALSPAELLHNRQALAERVGADDPVGARLLSRLLPPALGGIAHGGVVVFARREDPDFQALATFVKTVHAH